MLRLPISGLEVTLREPDGADELMLRETPGAPVAIAIALVRRLAGEGAWEALPVADFEILLLALRVRMFGDHLALGLSCPGCAARIEIDLRIPAYLDDVAPRRPTGVVADAARPGWYRVGEVGFRLPEAADQAAVAGRKRAARLLAERCLDRWPEPKRLRAVERAMEAMAPEISRPVSGVCPECGAAVEAPLHVTRLVIGELYRDAAGIYDEIDLIAHAYHWPEAAILALPRRRRRGYAERLRRAAQRAA